MKSQEPDRTKEERQRILGDLAERGRKVPDLESRIAELESEIEAQKQTTIHLAEALSTERAGVATLREKVEQQQEAAAEAVEVIKTFFGVLVPEPLVRVLELLGAST